jgi:23S rRNA (adenine2503-C2)-methyltransferase
MQTTIETPNAQAPLEKIALETYVPPAKPSLVGLSRAEIADQLGAIGVAPAQRKMRVQHGTGSMSAARGISPR